VFSALRRIYHSLPVIRELKHISREQQYALDKVADLERLKRKLQIDKYRRQLLSQERYENPRKLNRYEAQVFSQNGEDGIIAEIFSRIGVQSKTFLEIGVEAGLENNSVFLLFQDWSGIWIEGDEEAVERIRQHFNKPIAEERLRVVQSFVTAENVERVLQDTKIQDDLDLASFDIDRNTYWIWAALPRLNARVVVAEYNGAIPPGIDWKVDYDPSRLWDGTTHFGASLKAFELLGRQYGYCLVGCDLNGVNAFFVRQDLCDGKFAEPFTSEYHFEPFRPFLIQRMGYPPSFGDTILTPEGNREQQ